MPFQKTCPWCNKVFSAKLRVAKYCSYSCAARGTPRPQTQPEGKRRLVPCAECKKLFEVGPHLRHNKCCSLECANVKRARSLRENRGPPRPRRPRKQFTKLCRTCGKPFVVTTQNPGKQNCSMECGQKASRQGRKILIAEDLLAREVSSGKTMVQICETLNLSPHVIRNRMAEHGLRLPKRPLKKRVDGYWGYGTKLNHRRIMERHLGRTLLSREGVHHVDGDKINNEIDNLAVTSGTSQHALMHASLQRCAYALFKRGLIGFNRETLEYYLT